MKTLSASLFCVLFAAQAVLGQTSAPTTAPAKPQDPTIPAAKPTTRFVDLHEQYVARAKEGNVDLLFLGDSITYGWNGNGKEVWGQRYANLKPANFGIGGDQTQHVLWRIENGELDGIRPKVIVLMIGTNNTARGDADRIAEGITKIVRTAREKSGAKVLLLGVFPRGPRGETPEIFAEKRERITRINAIISKLDDGKDVRYLDLKDKFQQPDGTIPKEIMPDALHLSPKGYAIWAEGMAPLLTEMLAQ